VLTILGAPAGTLVVSRLPLRSFGTSESASLGYAGRGSHRRLQSVATTPRRHYNLFEA
jgi:hypothetical protein